LSSCRYIPEISLRQEISTKKFIEMIIVILSSTSARHLDPAKARTWKLSGILFSIGPIRHDYLLRDFLLSGGESMPEFAWFYLAEMFNSGFAFQHPTP
jgi:hypothetical protein